MNIRPEIREKVISAAKELNYTPNAFARMLAGHKTNLIAIVLGPATGPYYTQILLQFIYKLQQKQKQLLPFSMSGNMRYRDIFEQIRPFRVDAIILTSAASGAAFEPGETDIPIIIAGIKDWEFNNFMGAYSQGILDKANVVINFFPKKEQSDLQNAFSDLKIFFADYAPEVFEPIPNISMYNQIINTSLSEV